MDASKRRRAPDSTVVRSTPRTELAGALGEVIADVTRRGVRLIIRTAVEAEIDASLDRPR
ncbi:MAG: hypothetical protein WBZ37_02570 [Mycobacterium sp.]